LTDGKVFSRKAGRGGGVGRYNELPGRKNDPSGTGSEMTLPKNAMFAIHLEDSRGSRVREADDQYLNLLKRNANDKHEDITHPKTSSGQAEKILKASSCWRGSSLTLKILSRCAKILL
jgi:hypothetical protein